MGPSRLESERSFTINDMTGAHWELLFRCYEHNMKYSKGVIDEFIVPRGIFDKRRVIRALLKEGLRIVERYFDEFKREPYGSN